MSDKLRTPDAPLESVVYQQYIITMPAIAEIQSVFWGAVAGISFFTSWIDYGTMTAQEAAEYIKNIILSRKAYNMFGTVQAVIRDTLDDSMLLCDGMSYNKSDYPQLWDVWPAAMKDVATLTLPDLRNLFLVGATLDYGLGDEGGEAEHTLTEGEIPSHSHSNFPHSHGELIAIPSLADLGTGVPVPSATPSAGTTSPSSITIDPTGGGEAHNNLPPYYAVVYAVIAKVQP